MRGRRISLLRCLLLNLFDGCFSVRLLPKPSVAECARGKPLHRNLPSFVMREHCSQSPALLNVPSRMLAVREKRNVFIQYRIWLLPERAAVV